MAARRGFYRIPAGTLRDPGTNGPDDPGLTPAMHDSVLIASTSAYDYLFSGRNPNPELEAAGGEPIADTWEELHGALVASTRDKVFEAVKVDTDGAGNVVVQRAPRSDITGPPEEDWILPVAFGAEESVEAQERFDAARGLDRSGMRDAVESQISALT